MSEKVEWEVVDAPAQDARRASSDQLKALFGAGWRWKAAGAVIVAALAVTLAVILFATVTSAVFVVMTVCAILSALIAQVRQWLRHKARQLQ